ncbi:hypothetical protein ACFL5V_05030 [Fibrobacterota bacterium]
MHEIQELIKVDYSFNILLIAFEKIQSIEFDPVVVDDIFRDLRTGDQSARRYTLYSSPGLIVTGRVDAKLSDTIWIKAAGLFLDFDRVNKLFKEYRVSFGAEVPVKARETHEHVFKKRTNRIIDWSV